MLVLIVAIVAMIVSFYSKNSELQEMKAEKITEMILDEHKISFANDGIIDENKLREIQSMDYDDFKNSLKAKNDFCVYIEDGNGNIILAKGSPKLKEDGVCME